MSFVGEVESTNQNISFVFGVDTIGVAGIAVADALAIVAAQTKAQTGNRIVVDAERYTIFVGNVKLQR